MKLWERFAHLFSAPLPIQESAVCVQEGNLRAYIWPHDRQFSYEVINTGGERLYVGAEPNFDRARHHAMDVLRRLH